MTREEIIAAAEKTLGIGRRNGLWAGMRELSLRHLDDMLRQMRDPAFSIGKLNRWLGWMQAAVVAGSCGKVTLADMKEINRPKGDDLGMTRSPAQAAEGDVRKALASVQIEDDGKSATIIIPGSLVLCFDPEDGVTYALWNGDGYTGGQYPASERPHDAAAEIATALSAEGSATIAVARKQAAEDTARLNWLEANSNADISYEGWEDDVWQVHTVNGGRSDREWTLQGEGATVREAIDAAIKTLRLRDLPPSSSPEDQQKAAATPTIADPDGEARS